MHRRGDMGLMDEVGSILGRYVGGTSQTSDEEVHRDFDQVATRAPQPQIADGLATAFRSDKTPPFADMLGRMFGQASGQQRAGLLNTLIEALGPGIASQILSRAGGALSGFGGGRPMTPDEAQRVPSDVATSLAAEAEKRDPSVVDRISNFSASHPGLIKAIGAGALTMVLSHLARGQEH
jgi:hypothetical protein